MAKKSRHITINRDKYIRKYKIGLLLVSNLLANRKNFKNGDLKTIPFVDSLIRVLTQDRIDLWAYEENAAMFFLQHQGLNVDDYELVYMLREAQLYFAFKQDTKQEIDSVERNSASD
ncbi:MAG: hypothetical protein V7784_02805 [Oceanospirillaceae bacterium]